MRLVLSRSTAYCFIIASALVVVFASGVLGCGGDDGGFRSGVCEVEDRSDGRVCLEAGAGRGS